jgi:hypothetical protein
MYGRCRRSGWPLFVETHGRCAAVAEVGGRKGFDSVSGAIRGREIVGKQRDASVIPVLPRSDAISGAPMNVKQWRCDLKRDANACLRPSRRFQSVAGTGLSMAPHSTMASCRGRHFPFQRAPSPAAMTSWRCDSGISCSTRASPPSQTEQVASEKHIDRTARPHLHETLVLDHRQHVF